ncbi:MAG: hypothetical protein AB8C84_09750 [Oligoflexales bacterium]
MTQIITTWIILLAMCCTSGVSYSDPQRYTPQSQQSITPNSASKTSKTIRKAIVTAAVCTACCIATPTFLGSIHGFLSTHSNSAPSSNIAATFYDMILRVGFPEFFAYFYAKGLAFGASYYAIILQVIFEVMQTQAADNNSQDGPKNFVQTEQTPEPVSTNL